jgi:hypothetical protein
MWLTLLAACHHGGDPVETPQTTPIPTESVPTVPTVPTECVDGSVDVTDLTVEELPDEVLGRTLTVATAANAGVVVTCTLDAAPPSWHEPLPYASSWRYLETGVDPGPTWTDPAFDDSAWSEGVAPFAHEDNGTTLLVPAAAETPEIVWFRTEFTVDDPSAVRTLEGAARRDDGIVVYLNGVEVARDNVPPAVRVGGDDELTLLPLVLDSASLVTGVNTVAVELHQAVGSTDLGFGLRISTLVDDPPEDPPELHVLRDDAAATTHTLQLLGLLSEATYTCEAYTTRCDGATVSQTFETAELPVTAPPLASPPGQGTPEWGTWTLFNHQRPCANERGNRLFVIDPEGRVRWYRELPIVGPSTIDLESQWRPDQTILWGGGEQPQGTPQVLNLDGTVSYRSTYPGVEDDVYHHDVSGTADGRIIGIVESDVRVPGDSWLGFGLVEHDPATQAETWRWDSQTAFDAGQLDRPPADDDDPWHANAFAVVDDADGEGVYVSLFYENEIVRVDRATGDITWHLGIGRDFQLVDPSGAPLDDSEWFDHLHAVHVFDGRVFFYENGWGPGRSRVVVMTVDSAARKATLDWTYEEPGWYEPLWGDADETAAQSVVVAMAHNYCSGGTIDHLGSLLEIDEATGNIPWRLDFLDADDSTYRSQRIAGCDLFANARYCPDLLESIPVRQ